MTQEPAPAYPDGDQTGPDRLELLALLEGTTGPIYSLDWSPNSRWLASAGYARVRVWDATLHLETAILPGHTSFVWGLAWSPDGAWLASTGQDGALKVWDTANWQIMAEFDVGEWCFCAAWSPGGQYLAVGTGTFTDEARPETFAGNCKIFGLETRRLAREFRVSSLILSAAWSPDGRAIATGQWDGRITVMDSATGSPRHSLRATSERSDVNGLAWSPDGQVLASAHQDKKVRVWDSATGAIVATLDGFTDWPRGVTWSPGGQMLATGGADAEIRLWRRADWRLLACLAPGPLPVWSLKWSPDGNLLAAGDGLFGDETTAARVMLIKPPAEISPD